nr:hypothetical protein [Tanacetum cinerariifolium]
MDHNIDFSGSDQIQNPQYLDIQENPLTNDEFEAFMKANNDKINNLEIEFDHFQKQCEQMQDDLLNQIRNFMQNFQNGPPGEDKEHEATTDTELPSTKDIQPLPQKQKMEDTMLELVKIYQEKEFLCIHDDINDLIESTLDSKLLLINSNSQSLDKKDQEVKNVVEQPAEHGNHSIQSLQNFKVVHKVSISSDTSQISSIHSIAPILSTKEPKHLLSMGYEHLSITLETESDEVTESNAKNLLPIPSECEVALEDKRECDVPNSKNFPVCDNHSDIFSDSKIDDDISVYDDNFENIEYVEASLSDPEIVSIEEENVVQQEEEENMIRFALRLNPIRKELLIDDSILSHEIYDSNFEDNLSIPRPPLESPDTKTYAGEEIPVVLNNKDEDVYSSFIFVIFAKMFSLLSAESEDTIFDP